MDSHSPERHSLYNPVDDSLFCDQVQYAAAEDVEAAVEAAEAAFKGPWRKFTASKRGEALLKLSDLMLEHKEELAYLDGTPIGKTAAITEVEFAASILKCMLYRICTCRRNDSNNLQIMPDGPTNTPGSHIQERTASSKSFDKNL